MHYADTITAAAPVTYRWGFADGPSQAVVDSLERPNRDLLGVPTISIASPASGTTVTSPTVVVTGHAADNVDVTGLTVNGRAAALSGGAFSAPVTLARGANAIVAAVRDAAGNVATAHSTVTYTPAVAPVQCKVPKLTKTSLKAAKKALKNAHCRTGKVKKAYSKSVRKGRVVSSKPKAGTRRAANAKIGLTVSRGKRPRHHA